MAAIPGRRRRSWRMTRSCIGLPSRGQRFAPLKIILLHFMSQLLGYVATLIPTDPDAQNYCIRIFMREFC